VPKARVETALRFVGRIVDYCLDFEPFPERGTRHDEIAPGLRTDRMAQTRDDRV